LDIHQVKDLQACKDFSAVSPSESALLDLGQASFQTPTILFYVIKGRLVAWQGVYILGLSFFTIIWAQMTFQS
jgi:hypothetical protein